MVLGFRDLGFCFLLNESFAVFGFHVLLWV